MGTVQYIAKIFVLLALITVMVFGGLMWFDYLGVIELKKQLAPVYRLVGLQPQTGITASADNPFTADLDDDRLAKRLEALNVRDEELSKREADISAQEALNEQVARELEERRVSQDEKERTFEGERNKYNERSANVEQNARNLTGMAPQNAVNIMLAMDDQNVIDILRKTEEIAKAENASSMVAYWLSLMPAERAATIQRKMLERPAAQN
ncbi:MAG: flagellar protein FlbB [Spirochaetaceae bacterium]|jgi:flagellar protein FlbB|nr:flagellar protein FlbB [Spirochaetaceae bacterium]